jgi:hypothetical protein
MPIQPFIIAIVGFAILNGMFSPMLRTIFAALLLFAPAFFADNLAVVFFMSSITLSTLTIMVAGVPAALYERFNGLEESTPTSLYIWLFCTAILTIPAVLTFLDIGGF